MNPHQHLLKSGHEHKTSAEWLKALAQLDIVGVPYNSNPTALTDLMAGRTQVMFPDQNSATPHIQSGKLRILAATGSARSASFPDVPTMQESGYKGFTINVWSGVYGPAGMPQPLRMKLTPSVSIYRANRIVSSCTRCEAPSISRTTSQCAA